MMPLSKPPVAVNALGPEPPGGYVQAVVDPADQTLQRLDCLEALGQRLDTV